MKNLKTFVQHCALITAVILVLFVGSAAALSDNEVPLGAVYTNYLYSNNSFPGLELSGQNLTGWNSAIYGEISFVEEDGKYYIADSAKSAADSTLPGTYSKTIGSKTYIINVKYPSVTLIGKVFDVSGPSGKEIANLIGGTANTDNGIYIDVNADSILANDATIALTNPDKTSTVIKDVIGTATAGASVKDWDLGEWTITPVFTKGGNFSKLAPAYMYGEGATFTLISADTTKKLEASEDTVTQGGSVTITLQAPSGEWYVGVDKNAVIPRNQVNMTGILDIDGHYITNQQTNTEDYRQARIHVDSSNRAEFIVKAYTGNDFTVMLYANNWNATIEDEVTINVIGEAAITANVDTDCVYIGDKFEISGTNKLGGIVIFYIKGINYPLSFYGNTATGEAYATGSGTEWSATIDTSKLKNPDAGVYTIYVAKPTSSFLSQITFVTSTDDFDNTSRFDAYTTISVSLLQPFITATVKQSVVAQGDKLEVTGSAKGSPSRVKIYVFGTNFFEFDSVPVSDDGTYAFTKKVVPTYKEEADAWRMATGLYFLVVQHPMYDGVFNIGPIVSTNGGYDIVLNENGAYNEGHLVIFNTLAHQSSNAAEALIDAIGSQNIDDIQAHLSFIVAGLASYVNAVPSQVVKGHILTISGTTTGHTNEIVAVELLSTAFAAVPKETVGSAAFATQTTTIGEDGVWSISFDTANLNVDDYTVSIAVGQLDPVTAKTKIVTDGGTVTPTVPPTPTIDESNEYYVNPTGTLETGDKVTASMTVSYPDGSVIPTQLNLDSDLVGVSWTVVKNPGASNEMTCHPVYPYDCILNFDIYESSGSVILRITVNGTVSSESAGKSIVPLTLTETGGSGRVLIAPSQYVNGTVSPGKPEVTGDVKLNAGWNFISVPKKLSADYDTAGEFFSGVDSGDHPVLMYNAETKAWEQASAATKISPLNAYWIYSVSELTLPYAFDTTPYLPPTKAVYEGWNAVGISAEESMEAEAAFGNTDWYSFVAWNSGKQKYYSPIIRGNSGTYAETTLVSPWVGGWLYVNSDGTYLGYA